MLAAEKKDEDGKESVWKYPFQLLLVIFVVTIALGLFDRSWVVTVEDL